MQDGQFVETVKMLALLCMVGKAKGAGKGCAELLWQENKAASEFKCHVYYAVTERRQNVSIGSKVLHLLNQIILLCHISLL